MHDDEYNVKDVIKDDIQIKSAEEYTSSFFEINYSELDFRNKFLGGLTIEQARKVCKLMYPENFV